MYRYLTGEYSYLIRECALRAFMLKQCSMLKMQFVQSAKDKKEGGDKIKS